jgi:predicted nucleic acid-binding protein
VKICIDTSVLVAALVEDHPHFGRAANVLRSAAAKGIEAVASAHSLAELYGVLTRTPFTPRIYPSEARQMIEQSVVPHVGLIALSGADYRRIVAECSEAGWGGGMIYDALHIRAALKGQCDRLYTFNVKHFRALAPENFVDRISAP